MLLDIFIKKQFFPLWHCLRGDYDDSVHFSSADGGMDYPDHPGSLPLIAGCAVKIAKIKIPPLQIFRNKFDGSTMIIIAFSTIPRFL